MTSTGVGGERRDCSPTTQRAAAASAADAQCGFPRGWTGNSRDAMGPKMGGALGGMFKCVVSPSPALFTTTIALPWPEPRCCCCATNDEAFRAVFIIGATFCIRYFPSFPRHGDVRRVCFRRNIPHTRPAARHSNETPPTPLHGWNPPRTLSGLRSLVSARHENEEDQTE